MNNHRMYRVGCTQKSYRLVALIMALLMLLSSMDIAVLAMEVGDDTSYLSDAEVDLTIDQSYDSEDISDEIDVERSEEDLGPSDPPSQPESSDMLGIAAGDTYKVTLHFDQDYLVEPVEDIVFTSITEKYKVPDVSFFKEKEGYYIGMIKFSWSKGLSSGSTSISPGAEITISRLLGNSVDEMNGEVYTVSPSYRAYQYNIEYVMESIGENGYPVVSIDDDAENNPENPETYNIETDFNLKAPTRTGYTFEGWYTDPGYQNKIENLLGHKGDIKLYSKWNEHSYTVVYQDEEGESILDSITVGYDELLKLPYYTQESSGSRVRKWEMAQTEGDVRSLEPGNMVKRLSPTDGDTVVLTGKFESGLYYVYYELMDSKELPAENSEGNIQSYNAGSTFHFSQPTRKGFSFGGWYADSDYSERVTDIYSSDAKDITLYAKWTENRYTIRFHSNTNTDKVEDVVLTYSQVYELPSSDIFSYSNHRFMYWNTTKSSGSGEWFRSGTEVSRLTDENGAILEYYAIWLKAATSPMSSTNIRNLTINQADDYNSRYGKVVRAYLSENEDGTLTRVECKDKTIAVERYSRSGDFLDGFNIPFELSRWGGYYSGEKYNYFVFGQDNPKENNNLEVVRVVRYTKDFERVDSCAIKGIDVETPFAAGSLSMEELNGTLYIHTSRRKYKSSDGLNHQINTTILIKVEDNRMTHLNQSNPTPVWVSHSFNQYVIKDGNDIILADHGDSYPRQLQLARFRNGNISGNTKVSVLDIKGSQGDNFTGTSLGGVVATSKGYIVAANSIDHKSSASVSNGKRNILTAFVPKDRFDATAVEHNWITNYSSFVNMSTPSIVKIDDDNIMVIWEEASLDTGWSWYDSSFKDYKVKFVYLDSYGRNKSDGVSTLNGYRLSDMTPIVVDGKVVWYEAVGGSPKFRSIGACKVSFDSMGGTPIEGKYNINTGMPYSSILSTIPVPEKTGYDFDGWYTDPDKGTKVTESTKFSGISDVTLYAHWSPKVYNVRFVTGGSENLPDMKVSYGSKFQTLPDVDRYGYELTGWYDSEGEGALLITEESLYQYTGDITLYARFKKVNYLFVSPNGGYLLSDEETATQETLRLAFGADELPSVDIQAAKPKYRFIGWNIGDSKGNVTKEEFDFTKYLTKQETYIYASYEIKSKTANVAIGLPSGEYESGAELELFSPTPRAVIYYYALKTGDISDMTSRDIDAEYIKTNGRMYSGLIRLRENQTIFAVAVKEDYHDSDVISATYTIKEKRGDVTEDDIKSDERIPEHMWVAPIQDIYYTGAAITPAVRVFDGPYLLTKGIDYTVSYSNNKKANQAKVTINGKGNYKGKMIAYFNILPLKMVAPASNSSGEREESDGEKIISAPDINLLSTGAPQKKPTKVTAVINGKTVTLKNGTDYELVYDDAYDYTNPGSHKVIIRGKNNFDGEVDYHINIYDKETERLFEKVKIKKLPDMTFDGEAVIIEKRNLELTYDGETLGIDDFDIIEASGLDSIGTAALVLQGNGIYHGQKKVTFKIKGMPISKATVSGIQTGVEYTGEPIVQDKLELAIAKDGVMKTLQPGLDYTIDYKDTNINAGKATVTITGKGMYTGTMKKTFTIVPYVLNTDGGKRVRVAYEKTHSYIKGGVQPDLTVTYEYNGNTVKLEKGKDYTVKYKNNGKNTEDPAVASKAESLPRIIITGKGNYKGLYTSAAGIDYMNFAINRKDLADIAPDSFVINDIVWKDKSGICKPTFALYDTNGKKLSAGTDYNNTPDCYYAHDVVVMQRKSDSTRRIYKKEGDKVDKSDIIPRGTEIRVVVKAVEKATCNYTGSIEKVIRFGEYDIAKAKIKILKPHSYTKGGVWLDKDDIEITIGGVPLDSKSYMVEKVIAGDKVGTATLVIKGIGEYCGTKKQTFKIRQKMIQP